MAGPLKKDSFFAASLRKRIFFGYKFNKISTRQLTQFCTAGTQMTPEPVPKHQHHPPSPATNTTATTTTTATSTEPSTPLQHIEANVVRLVTKVDIQIMNNFFDKFVANFVYYS